MCLTQYHWYFLHGDPGATLAFGSQKSDRMGPIFLFLGSLSLSAQKNIDGKIDYGSGPRAGFDSWPLVPDPTRDSLAPETSYFMNNKMGQYAWVF